MAKKSLSVRKIEIGVCYYPEHWPEALWADDFRRMREMGLAIIRIAEFAWTIFEPHEGLFDFSFFDRVMDLAHQHGLRVILGTPTATPPAWLTHKYPEVLNASQAGVVYGHGQRRHYNYNASIYRELCARIAGNMAEHYTSHPALYAWQIDNEFNCETNVFYSRADDDAFRAWLRQKYATLDELNAAWGAVFWNQTYSDWDQVHLSRPTPSDSPNPHQVLDEKRFVSNSVIEFARVQADAIRAYDKVHAITTNGLFGHIDNHALTEELLDFISYDSYPLFSELWPDDGEHPLLDRAYSGPLSAVRDISPNFCVMEQQSGAGGWVNRMTLPSPKPGQMRLWTYQSIAHGADLVLYFRWRTATVGTEIYWHGINDYHNRPNRRCAEAAKVCSEVARFGNLIAGTRYRASVALLKTYDNDWDGEFDIWHGPFTQSSVAAWHQALQRLHVPIDSVTMRPGISAAVLSAYRCVVYPHAAILTDETAAILADYVQLGGTIVFGARTGYKNAHGHCVMRPLPGPVADLCGITVDDFTRVSPSHKEPALQWRLESENHGKLTSGQFNEVLHVESHTARVIATFGNDAGYYAGFPAIVENNFGSGRACYFGGVFNEPVARALALHLGLSAPAADLVTVPPDVELAIREDDSGSRFLFLLNYADSPKSIQVHSRMDNLVTGHGARGELSLGPYDVAVLRV